MTPFLLSFLLCADPALTPPDPNVPAQPMRAAPTNLRIPPMGFDEKSVLLVWEKPANYPNVVDYVVSMDGRKIGTANANNGTHSPAKPYIDAFYEADTDRFHTPIQFHTFTVAGLKPNRQHTFTVSAIDKNGTTSTESAPLIFRTPTASKVVDITRKGAKGDGKAVNTQAIQAAIDICPKGGKVLVPKGVWKTGALFLKSDMTLEIAEGATLLGSEAADDYPLGKGYRLYPYSKFDRPPSLLNLLAPEAHVPGTFQNVRIVGKGTIDGNGWKRASEGTVKDELGRDLPVYVASNNKKVQADGILAKAQFEKGLADGLEAKIAYGQRRSSLILLRGARNVFIGGITVRNPAFHGIMALESENVTVAGTVHQTYDANNADGIEFGNSAGGLVVNNFFDTGDDGVNFAAGTGIEAEKQAPQRDVWIFNNYFRQGHGAVVVGSHTGAWIEGILAEDNVAVGTDVGLRCKSTVFNGGGGRNIVFRDNALKGMIKHAFIFTLEYKDENAAGDYVAAKVPASFHDIAVRNVTVDGVKGSGGSILVKGDTERNAFHKTLAFDQVRLRNVPAAVLADLKDSVFRDVTFTRVVGNAKEFTTKNTDGIRFEGTTPKP